MPERNVALVEKLQCDPAGHEFAFGKFDAFGQTVGGAKFVRLLIETAGQCFPRQNLAFDPPDIGTNHLVRFCRRGQQQRQRGMVVAATAFITHLVVQQTRVGTEQIRNT